MKTSRVLFICIIALSVFASCRMSSEEKAKKRLKESNIEFTENNFLAKCSSGDTETVRLFIAAGVSPNIKENPSGKTPLMEDPSGKTALILASEYGNLEIVKALINAGADVNTSAKEFTLDKEVKQIVPKDFKFPENRRISNTALFFAQFNDHDEVIKVLLEARADPNVRDWMGRTPLFKASGMSRSYSKRVVKVLLEGGADPNIRSYTGGTPLLMAALWGEREKVEMLLNAGADCSKTYENGKTVTKIVQESGHETIAYTDQDRLDEVREVLKSRCK